MGDRIGAESVSTQWGQKRTLSFTERATRVAEARPPSPRGTSCGCSSGPRVFSFATIVSAAGQGKEKDKDKVDLKKLMGKWEPKDGKIVIEFADKGKLVMTVDFGGKSEKIDGSYKLDGNKLDVIINFMGKEQKETLTVKSLTDAELVTTDSKGKDETLKRKK